MGEVNAYACSKCGGHNFRVDTTPIGQPASLAVLIVCLQPGCAHGVEAESVTAAFVKISEKTEPK